MNQNDWDSTDETPLVTAADAASVEEVLLVVAPVLQDGRVAPARAVSRVGEAVHVGHAGVIGGVVEPVH